MPRNRRTAGFRKEEAVKKDESFIRISESMYCSKAWEMLSVQSRYLYLEFKIKYNGKNVDDISFTYAEGRKLLGVNRFNRCIKELIEYGFIKVVRNGKSTRQCNIYGLSDKWQSVK